MGSNFDVRIYFRWVGSTTNQLPVVVLWFWWLAIRHGSWIFQQRVPGIFAHKFNKKPYQWWSPPSPNPCCLFSSYSFKLQEQIAENRANLIREHLAAKDLGVWAPVLDFGPFRRAWSCYSFSRGKYGPFGDEKLIFQGLILLEIFHDDRRKSRRKHTSILELFCVHVGSCFSSFSALYDVSDDSIWLYTFEPCWTD